MARGSPPERVFLDSNILVYAHSASDAVRRERARAIADLPGAVVSAQVLGELANVLLRKFARTCTTGSWWMAACAWSRPSGIGPNSRAAAIER